MKRMLFNATQPEELRVAIVDGQKLIDLDIETAGKEQRKSNIYKAVITRIEPSLEACFVEYGGTRHGFLPFKEVSPQYYSAGAGNRPSIKEALKEGQELLVQVEKDERGNKGAALTTYISLAGRYIVLMPNNPNGGGVSRRIEGEDRNELRDVLAQMEVPHGMSIIARTAGIGRNLDELQWDLDYLKQLWDAIEGAAESEKAPSLIYLESSLVVRAIRDYFNPEIGEILIDTDDIYHQAQAFMSTVMPDHVDRIKRYHDDVPLFSRFQIEHQIESAHARQVNLPSGGAIVIDHTEALTAIDINSARATRGGDIETTALNTNLEAADEIARQLRLRDLGGLIVIDFIDMESSKNQREVENRLRDALHFDRARIQTAKISRFGLLELSRQRLAPSLEESSYSTCPRCNGIGHIRGTESSALNILRIIQEEAMKDSSAAIHAQVPVDVATFLLNEKRADIHRIESRFKTAVILIPNPHMETPQYNVTRLRQDDITADHLQASYKLVEKPEEVKPALASTAQEIKAQRPQAAVRGITPAQPAPKHEVKTEKKTSLLGSLVGWLKSLGGESEPAKPAAPAKSGRGNQRRERGERSERGERGERGEGGKQRRDRNEGGKQQRRDRNEAPRTDNKEQKEQPENRGERQQQQPRQPRPSSVDKPALEAPKPVVAGEEGNGNREGRKRGRRGGRRERERREQQVAAPSGENAVVQTSGQSAAPATGEIAAVPAPVQRTTPTEYVAYPDSMKKARPTEVVCYPAQSAPAPATVVAAPAAAPAPVAAPVDLGSSGLTLIETDPNKAASIAPAQENRSQPPRRRQRPREIYTIENSEPLQQVETHSPN
ncbi:Rne/Rng family ribonuclease [Sideroxydans lithotrophicus]|uniref:Ribonuclease E n=1 Tax=Sideroxydans lithotrophicus (strain ES-1) TaxID=580332 RepID=D5CSQ3_SIDLE|nr:Rne/Rng family ribonuclease [Sideroxydans lithotrophicus]ADE11989.1 ribonuclease, Rne/Rng family [Sideroxydans lithotrophicus ES-1]